VGIATKCCLTNPKSKKYGCGLQIRKIINPFEELLRKKKDSDEYVL